MDISATLTERGKFYMAEEHITLARIRLERAEELLQEASHLLENGSYKSANNRAYYAIEKSIKALLAIKQIEATTHSGGLKQFNAHFIHQGDGTFVPDDYQLIAKAERIRNASDYDDFYIANKQESKQQVENAKYIVAKIRNYLDNYVS